MRQTLEVLGGRHSLISRRFFCVTNRAFHFHFARFIRVGRFRCSKREENNDRPA